MDLACLFMNLHYFIYLKGDDLIESALKHPNDDLLPCSCLHFQQRINISAKVINYSRVNVIFSFAFLLLSQLSSFSLLDETIPTVAAPFVCAFCPLLLMSFEFSLPKILPCPLSSLQHHPPPHHLHQGLMGAQQYKFPFIPVAGADDTAAFTPQIDEPSDADLLYMAATLEPPHIWSGVRLLKNWGQPWPKQV